MNPNPRYQAAMKKISAFHAQQENARVPLTHWELDALADDAAEDLRRLDLEHGLTTESAPVDTRARFTCYACTSACTCPFVYDLYNADGDCLASK
jgi:hypothetical protein